MPLHTLSDGTETGGLETLRPGDPENRQQCYGICFTQSEGRSISQIPPKHVCADVYCFEVRVIPLV